MLRHVEVFANVTPRDRPGQTPVGATTFNWGVVMFFGIALISAFWYMIVGRKIYKGPVSTVMGREHDA